VPFIPLQRFNLIYGNNIYKLVIIPYKNNWHSFRKLLGMKRVLIVDDEIDLCSMIKLFLTKKNYEVHTAHTLSDGFKKIDSIVPDALLLDNNLPDGMGWNFAENIHEQYPKMNITLISAYHASKELKARLGSSVHILEKPISLKDIEQYL
jgi:two-component system, OmpR family, response regulator